jgi:hypothetical protein
MRSHGEAHATVDHADRQDGEAVAEAGGIDGQRQARALPQTHNPAQERHEAGGDIERLALAAGFSIGLVTPFAQAVLHAADLTAQQ